MKILVPVDGSPYSLKAVESACNLAKAQPSSQTLLLAVAPELYDLEDGGHYVADKLKGQAERALSDAKAKAQEKGVSPQTRLASGVSVADEIVRLAKEENADLVVIGSRGLGAKTSFFLGGTATKVVTYAPCSVLVVKTPKED